MTATALVEESMGLRKNVARTGRFKKNQKPPTGLAAIMKEQGRKWVWLAQVTGYSPTHVNAMGSRREPMTSRFIKLAASALGVPEEAIL